MFLWLLVIASSVAEFPNGPSPTHETMMGTRVDLSTTCGQYCWAVLLPDSGIAMPDSKQFYVGGCCA